MRAFHLLGLQGEDNTPLRYRPHGDAALVLPAFIRPPAQQTILAFYQQIIESGRLPRTEVTWRTQLLGPDRRFLDWARNARGSSGTLVVVKVAASNVDLHEVLLDPTLAAFEHLVITCDHAAHHENLGPLSDLSAFVRQTGEDLYHALIEPLGLRDDGWALVSELAYNLLNPVDVLEVVNALIHVQLEGLSPDKQADAIYARTLTDQLRERSAESLIALLGLATGHADEAKTLLGTDAEVEWTRLRGQLLLLDGELQRWAAHLCRSAEALSKALPTRAQQASEWDERVREALGWLLTIESGPAAEDLAEKLNQVLTWMNEGRLSQAEERLVKLENRILAPDVDLLIQSTFYFAIGHLKNSQRQFAEAIPAFYESLNLLHGLEVEPMSLLASHAGLALALQRTEQWEQSRASYRRTLELLEGVEAPGLRDAVLSGFTSCLMQSGQVQEAEAVLRQLLDQTREERSQNRVMRLYKLALILRDKGDWDEAEPLFHEAIQLQSETGLPTVLHGGMLLNLAIGLNSAGQGQKAEAVWIEAIGLLRGSHDIEGAILALKSYSEFLKHQGRRTEARTQLSKARRLKQKLRSSRKNRS